MGSESNEARRHFDLSMSRRTRKPFNTIKVSDHSHPKSFPSQEGSIILHELDEEDKSDRKSLNQLIGNSHDESEGREKNSSLSQHFRAEEQQLQLVRKPNKVVGENGLKLRGMMGKYAKVLSNLIKAKHEPQLTSRKKALIRLKSEAPIILKK